MRFDASLTMLFPDAPLTERFASARRAGFGAVELQDLAGESPERLADAARAAGVEVVLINASLGDATTGGPGLSGVPGRQREFGVAIDAAAAAAQALGCPCVHVGPCRVPDAAGRGAALDVLVENLRFAGDALGRHGIAALVEAINPHDVPGVLVDRVAVALEVIERANHPNVRLLLDVYHLVRTESEPLPWVARTASRAAHVQIADVPGRGAPGTGKVDFAAVYAALRSEGYRGWIGAEYVPKDPAHATAAWLASRGAAHA